MIHHDISVYTYSMCIIMISGCSKGTHHRLTGPHKNPKSATPLGEGAPASAPAVLHEVVHFGCDHLLR